MHPALFFLSIIAGIYLLMFLYGFFVSRKGEQYKEQIPEIVIPPVKRGRRSSRWRPIQENEYPYYDPTRNDETLWWQEVEPRFRKCPVDPPDWQRRRALVFIRDGRRCQSKQCGRRCGKLACAPNQIWNFQIDEQLLYDAHVHHIKHRASGGDHDLKNLVLYCPRCHMREHPENTHLYASVVSRALSGEVENKDRRHFV